MRLSVEGLSFAYGGKAVLSDISFQVDGGKFFSVLGANGAGKTTLFQCILGNLTGYTGEILADGKNVANLSPAARAACFAYIPQIRQQVFSYPVLEMVLMGTTRQLSIFARPGEAQEKTAREALALLGIDHLKDRDFKTLSGGEQQLVLVARALAQRAQVLIMDEPTSSLDYGNQYRVLSRVRALTKEGYTILLSTHNPQHALAFADSMLALSDKHIAAIGAPNEVLTEALMKKLYHMEVAVAHTDWGRLFVPLGEGDFYDEKTEI